ncbi:MAG: NERD domain-containing protein, partial [Actinomycetota bacterium]|nr:NERD domain-containing protein [Actinomycetota bacterium]
MPASMTAGEGDRGATTRAGATGVRAPHRAGGLQRLCEQLPDDAVVLANLRFTDRSGDLEADLVVALPGAGVAVLEVKGGAVTHDGTSWRQA